MNKANLFGCLMLLGALAPACSSETVAMPPAPPVHFRSPDPAPRPAASPTTPTDKERGLAKAYLKALGSPKFLELGSVLDRDAHFSFGARDARGKGRVVQNHDEMFGAFDERNFATSRVWLTDSTRPVDSQAIEWTMTGVQARDWMGVAPTGKPVVIKGLTLLWLNDDGIISELHVYFDEEVVKAQLGSGPEELKKLPLPSADPGPPQVLERSGTPEEKENVAVVRAMLQALEDNSEKDFLSTMVDDVDVFTLDRPEAAHGNDSARSSFRSMRKSIRQLDTVVQNAWSVGSFAIVEYSITGLQLAAMRRIGLRADGALHPLHTQFLDVAEIHNRKITRIWRFANPGSFGSL